MENELQQVVQLLHNMNENFEKKLNTIETRLARLEKVDSIEHRVTVNQIDITDIKELVQKLGEQPKIINAIEGAITRFEKTYQSHVEQINRRMDSQLLKIAKTEEEILTLKNHKN
ncbi:hypothetical protein [Bacillus dakarensis]|uniref:hypothetical protein n=1 Tax=Robertmurraya dakarensis TaxID=1926278 RepID=UPI0009819088|nr:hypothetical protein [Bacillus dakarensis]